MSRMHSLVMPAHLSPHVAPQTKPAQYRAPIEMAKPAVVLHVAEPAPVEPHPSLFFVQGWMIPAGYTVCGLSMALCNLISPGHIRDCAHLLCPLWTLSLGMHTATQWDSGWGWLGALTIFFLPFVILVRDSLFVAFYLLVFASFSLSKFWLYTQGVQFILACVCSFGVVAGCALSLVAGHQPQAQLSVAAFFAISGGVIGGSRLGKMILRIS